MSPSERGGVIAVNAAKSDVAAANRDGDIGQAEAHRVRDIRLQKTQLLVKSVRRVQMLLKEEVAVLKQPIEENTSKASIAEYNANLAEKEAEAMQRAEVARRTAEMEVQKAQYMLEQERLRRKKSFVKKS